MMKFQQIAEVAIERTQQTGGASVEVVTGREAPATGYMVATAESHEIRLAEVTVEALVDYLESIEWREGLYLGLWTEGGEVFVDVSQRIEDREEALRQARILDEIAVFDLEGMDTVYA